MFDRMVPISVRAGQWFRVGSIKPLGGNHQSGETKPRPIDVT
jgi:hypothetical protein